MNTIFMPLLAASMHPDLGQAFFGFALFVGAIVWVISVLASTVRQGKEVAQKIAEKRNSRR